MRSRKVYFFLNEKGLIKIEVVFDLIKNSLDVCQLGNPKQEKSYLSVSLSFVCLELLFIEGVK